MSPEQLINRINNEKHAVDTVWRHVRGLRHLVDLMAAKQSRENALWHDDPNAADHAEYHAPADEQFNRDTRDAVVRELVRWYLEEENNNEYNAQHCERLG